MRVRIFGRRRWCGAAVLVLALAACTSTPTPPSGGSTTPGDGQQPPSPTPTHAAPTTAPSPSDPLAACRATAAAWPVERQAAQLVMMGVSPAGLDAAAQTLVGQGVGGIFYTSRSGAAQSAVSETSRGIQAGAPTPVLISVDQEGGQVQGLAGAGFEAIPSATQQATLPPERIRAAWTTWGGELAAAGVNVNLAPVADVVPAGTEAHNPPVGAIARGYGSDPGAVAQRVGAVLDGMSDGRVSGTLKHFPNLGRVSVNTDFGAATDAVTTLDDPALQPFYANLPKAGMVMMSLATYTRIDPGTIAAFSPTVHRALREHGFTGVVISDDLGAAAAVQATPVGQRAVLFVRAGGDMALAVSSATAGAMVEAIGAAAAADPAFASLVTDRAARILAYKEKLGLLRCG